MRRLSSFFLFLWCVWVCAHAQDYAKVIAHRGYWQTYGSAQNSIRALERADEIKVYGAEFDVHMTTDSVLVVFHDAAVNGFKLQEVPYPALQDVRLSNGECIPTLREYLAAARYTTHVRLILELKSHASAARDVDAAGRHMAF